MQTDISSSYSTYYYVVLVLASISIICHIVGLLAIHLYKRKTNQNIILTFLSLADVAGSIHRILSECLLSAVINRKIDSEIVLPALRGIFFTAVYAMVLAYLSLTFDRLICCTNPIKYKARMTRRKVQIIVVISLLFAIIMGLASGLTSSFGTRKWINLVGLILGGLVVVSAIVTYFVIIVKMRKSRLILRTDSVTGRNSGSRLKKEFLMPMVLVSTYILFYIIPTLIINFYPWSWDGTDEFRLRLVSIGYCICFAMPQIGSITDALTLIFLAKHYRNTIMNLFRKNRGASLANGIAIIARGRDMAIRRHDRNPTLQ